MNIQRDAILGYAKESHAYYIELIGDETISKTRYGLICDEVDEEKAERVMTTLILKKSFWLNGSNFKDIVTGLQPITV